LKRTKKGYDIASKRALLELNKGSGTTRLFLQNLESYDKTLSKGLVIGIGEAVNYHDLINIEVTQVTTLRKSISLTTTQIAK